MNFVNKYEREICWISIGFYLCSVVLAYADAESKDIISVLNSIGGVISAAGAVAAILTVIHVVVEKERADVKAKVTYLNYVLFILNRQSEFFNIYNEPLEKLDFDNIKNLMSVKLYAFEHDLCNQVDIERSMCLLETGNPDLLSKLDELQRNFLNLSRVAKKRKELIDTSSNKLANITRSHSINSELKSSTVELKKLSLKLAYDVKWLHANIVFEAHKQYPNCNFILPTT